MGCVLLVAADIVVWSQMPVKHTPYRELGGFETPVPEKISTVSIVRSDDPSLSKPIPLTQRPEYEQVAEMVERALELAGGLEKYLGDNVQKIVIKPNIVEPAPNENGVNTDWRVVKALVLKLYSINPDYEIYVAEAAGGWARPGTPNVATWALRDGYQISGYQEMIEELQASREQYPGLKVEWVDLNYDEVVKVPVLEPRLSTCQTHFYLPKTLVECDFLINTPVLKVHTTRVTVALKNYVGALPGMIYGWSKDGGYNRNGLGLDHSPDVLEENFVDVARTVGCDFVVVDAIVGKEKSKYTSGMSKRRNMIVAGEDLVSADAVCAKLMDINPDDVEHICLGALSGLGQNDFSRIAVTGSTIEESKTKFIKSESSLVSGTVNSRYRYYGQSNRIWLLNGPFTGTDLDSVQLNGGEAEATPVAGNDGWTEPVYFFDNLIDPAGYFQCQSNCIYYAFSYLYSPKEQSARMYLGSGQDLKVWLNGEKVYQYNSTRSHKLPNDVEAINLRAGINRLLVKTVQWSGQSDFSLNICENETNSSYAGNRVEGLKFMTSQEIEADAVIRGQVIYRGRGLGNITLELTDVMGIQTTVTSDNGQFLFSELPAGSYNLTPRSTGYSYEPSSKELIMGGYETREVSFEAEAVVRNCDFSGDGRVTVADVISFLLLAREQPDNEAMDWNGDGAYSTADVVALLLDIRNKACTAGTASLAGGRELPTASGKRTLSSSEIAYLEEVIGQMQLTLEQEEVLRAALGSLGHQAELPRSFALHQNYPNPFNPSTMISFEIPEKSTEKVELSIFDQRGRLIRTLVDQVKAAGTYHVLWDGCNQTGQALSSGVYFYRLRAGDFSQNRKLILLK
ncbi:MAG: DUF362 domain-containing protein [Candidatus Glassbacteria bacterium]|nr:DUF362 domain-containing protein [Candidatus Glassbacteria bacterium]